MLVGDSVLLQEKRKIFRPSDLGKPVEISGAWTLKFNNGAVITTTEDTYFKIAKRSFQVEDWVTLRNLSRFSIFGLKEPFKFSNKNWDSVIELSDYVDKKGEFDLSNLNFARFCGAFIKLARCYSTRPNAYRLNKAKFGNSINYAKSIYPREFFEETEKEVYLVKCWVDSLIDVIFNFTEVISIPDDLLFKFSEEWVDAFTDGFFSACLYDKSKKAYILESRLRQLISDYGIIMTRFNRGFQVNTKYDQYGAEILTIKFVDKSPPLSITDGYENLVPQVLYDVGDGEFNASGIWIKS